MDSNFQGVLKHSGKAPGYFAAITVVAVSEQTPDEVFKRFCHPLGHPEVFSSVKAVEELSRVEQPRLDGKQCSELEVNQLVELSVLGKTLTAPMRLKLIADHEAQQERRPTCLLQLRFSMLESNSVMRKVEGVYAVLPCWGPCSSHQLLLLAGAIAQGANPAPQTMEPPHLMASVSSQQCSGLDSRAGSRSGGGDSRRDSSNGCGSIATSLDSSSSSSSSRLLLGRQDGSQALLRRLNAAGHVVPQPGTLTLEAVNRVGRCAACESDEEAQLACRSRRSAAPPRSIIIMHQKVKPCLAPPPPFSRLLRGHLVRQFETMMLELLAACQRSVLSSAAAAGGALTTQQ